MGEHAARVEPLSSHVFVAALALISAVIVIAALLSGLVERSGIPQVAVFLALGAALGPAGLEVLSVDLSSPALRVVATLSLALILFTDALSLSLHEVRANRRLVALVVGPGTLLAAALFSLLGAWWLGLSWPAAAILGGALASTDPVLLRGFVRRGDLGSSARLALRLESGLNDAVLLPIVLVAAALLAPRVETDSGAWAKLGTDLLLLGPAAGVAVGVGSLATLDMVRRRLGVRRDYESLYSLGVAFAAYAAAESVGGSGFLAAFAAGLTIAAFDVELCDCFREYGETTAELALLLTFVLLGSSLIWTGVAHATPATLGFALLVLLGRPAVYLAALAATRIDWRERWLVAWFGPRGLSSLLLVLLAVFLGVPGSDELFRIACLVVLLSVVFHGGALMWMGRAAGASSAPGPAAPDPVRIGTDELRALQDAQADPVIVDVRSEAAWNESDVQAARALRVEADRIASDARIGAIPMDAWIVLYCT
jgi:NhaP-type Na+/H+ or K+/H+ antiporter